VISHSKGEKVDLYLINFVSGKNICASGRK